MAVRNNEGVGCPTLVVIQERLIRAVKNIADEGGFPETPEGLAYSTLARGGHLDLRS